MWLFEDNYFDQIPQNKYYLGYYMELLLFNYYYLIND